MHQWPASSLPDCHRVIDLPLMLALRSPPTGRRRQLCLVATTCTSALACLGVACSSFNSSFIAGGSFLCQKRLSAHCLLRAKGTPTEPWKPLVFKMPQKKAPREIPPDDDGFTIEMRNRLKNLRLKEEKEADERRSVSETKVDDLIAKEADDAKINGLNAMWYMDKLTDQARAEAEQPDAHVLRRKYQGALKKLDGTSNVEEQPKKRRNTRAEGLLRALSRTRHGRHVCKRSAPSKQEARCRSIVC